MKLLFLYFFYFFLLELTFGFTNPCIIFYTGGSNLMSTQIYSDFLSTFENKNIDIYKIPFQCNKQSPKFFKEFKKSYSSITLLAHSSGCARALNNCNSNIDNIILLDPVKTPNWDSNKNLDFLDNILIINAEKSYKWSIIPPFVPFIPFFNIDKQDLNIKMEKVKKITVKDYGHSDIIDKPYRDIMHYSRISVGNNNRDNILEYHKLMSNIISEHILSKD